MGERAHTPGPWKVFETPTGKVVGIGRQSDGYAVADAGFGVWGEHSAEATANARLIVAAPDMFEAIEEARSQAEMLLLAIIEGDPASELKLRVNDLLDVLAKATPTGEASDV